jgi:hypothetical protein
VISDDRLPLEVVWPEVHRRLLRFLHARGTDASTAEDIVQEVALRVVALDVSYESADDLMRWAATAARNLAIDQWRADSRYGAVPLEEAASAVDVDATVEHRLRLEAVGDSWMRLSERDREALRSGALGTKASSRTEGVRWAVQRHAARARLTAMIDGLAGVVVWVATRFRYRPRRTSRAVLILSVPALAVAVVLLPHALQLVTPEDTDSRPARLGRRTEQAVDVSTRTTVPAVEARPRSSSAARGGATKGQLAGVVPYGRVGLGHESKIQKGVETWRKRPDNSLACVWDVPLLPPVCVNPALPPLPKP